MLAHARTLRTLLLAILLLPLVACGHKARSGSYLVTVREPYSDLAIEGATVEMTVGGSHRATGVTDGRGEALLLLPSFSRAELRVGFDGETDRYFVRTARIQPWGTFPEDVANGSAEEQTRTLLFLPGAPAGTSPRFASDLRFVRSESPR